MFSRILIAAMILGLGAAHAQQLAGNPGQPFLDGLLDARSENLDLRAVTVTSAASALSGPDLRVLARALLEDPRAADRATSLTFDLRKQGVIPASEEVMGVRGQEVLTAPTDQVQIWQR